MIPQTALRRRTRRRLPPKRISPIRPMKSGRRHLSRMRLSPRLPWLSTAMLPSH